MKKKLLRFYDPFSAVGVALLIVASILSFTATPAPAGVFVLGFTLTVISVLYHLLFPNSR